MQEEGYSRELALFEKSVEDRGVQSISYIEYQPSAPLSGTKALEFHHSGNTTDYVDLSRTRLHVKFKITKADDTEIKAVDNVTVINFPLQSFWSQIDVTLQNQLVSTDLNTHYSYKSYIDALLESNPADEDILLPSQLFYRDTAGSMEGSPVTLDGVELNAGATQRYVYTSKGTVDLIGPLYFDLAQQKRLILNAVPIHIKLWPNSDAFRLMVFGTEKYKVVIESAKLNLCLVKLYPSVVLAHAAALKETPAIYEYNRSLMLSYQIPANSYQFTQDNLFQGVIPNSIIVGLVKSKAFSGDFKSNPFNFSNNAVKSIAFYIDGQSAPYSRPIEVNYADGNYLEGYMSLHDNTNSGLPIPREEYPKGFALYRFNLDPRYNKTLASPQRNGLTRLEIIFKDALSKPLTVIIYATSPGIMKIDGARNVII